MATQAIHTARELGEAIARFIQHAVAGTSPVQVLIPLIRKAVGDGTITCHKRDKDGKLVEVDGAPVAVPLNTTGVKWQNFTYSSELALEVTDLYSAISEKLLETVEKAKRRTVDQEVRAAIRAACGHIAREVGLKKPETLDLAPLKIDRKADAEQVAKALIEAFRANGEAFFEAVFAKIREDYHPVEVATEVAA